MQYFETAEIVNPMIDYLIHKCGQVLYEHYLESKEPGYNCEMVEVWQCGVVQQEFLPFDHGESKYAILNKWIEEDEPHFKTIDNMTAKGVKIVKPPNQNAAQDAADDNRSSKSASSSRFSRNSIARFQNSVSKMKLINKIGGSLASDLQSAIPEEYKPNLIKMPDTKKPPTPDAIIERLREQREYQELDKQKENERMKKIREEQVEYEEKKKEQQKQLKNKQYTYDYDGQIVFLTTNTSYTRGIDLQVNEILSPETRTNQPLKVMKEINSQPEIKPVKEAFAKGEEENRRLEKAAAVEYPKQPPLIEAMKPKLGTNIIFDNGYIKEGGEFKILDRVSKRDYQTMVDGQQQNKKNPKYEDKSDQIDEQLDTYDQRIQDAINKTGDRDVKITNEQQFKWMMEDEDIKKSYRSSSAESANVKSVYDSKKQSKKYTTKEPEKQSALKKSKSKLDRINAYKQFDDMKKPSKDLKSSKLHKALNEFDQKLQSPMWGYNDDKEVPRPSSTIYKLKHQSESQPKLPTIKTKGRL